MQTLRVGQGYSDDWVITLRNARGAPVVNVYDGTETLSLVISDLLGVQLTLIGSTVDWCVVTRDVNGDIVSVVVDPAGGAAGTVRLHIDDADTAETFALGSHGLTIALTAGSEPVEVYRAVLKVEPRASAPIIVP